MINFFKTYYAIVLFLLVIFPIFEVHLIIFFLTSSLLFFQYNKISKKLLNVLFVLTIIVLIGMISSIFQDKTFYDWLKDLLYFIKPIIALLSGYYIAKRINDWRYILKSIVLVALVLAITHIIKVVWHIDFSNWTINEIRKFGGISNMIEVFAIIIILGSYKFESINVFKNSLLRKVTLFILSISFIFYFSRTMAVAFVIFYLSLLGYIKFTQKGIKYGFFIIMSVGLLYVYLFSVEIQRDGKGIQSFLYKLKIAPAEIFIPDKNIDINNHASLWDHWRAYEAKRAIEQMKPNPFSFLAGNGFGALVDLTFEAPLGDDEIRYIPILHNGYIYILFKTGLVGLFLYLIFLLMLYLNSFIKESDSKKIVINNLIAGFGIYYLFSSLVITGIYNMNDIFTFILGILFYLQISDSTKKLKQTQK